MGWSTRISGWVELVERRARARAELLQHRAGAHVTIVLAFMNLVFWAFIPFGPQHVAAGLVLILALTLCYFKYWRR